MLSTESGTESSVNGLSGYAERITAGKAAGFKTMTASELLKLIENGGLDERLASVYGTKDGVLGVQRDRYASLVKEFSSRYGADRDISLFSVPGRSELSGNHTDHNRGRVIACSVSLDIIAAASPRDDRTVRIKSEGFPEDTVDLSVYTSPDPSRFGRSDSLIAGVADGFSKRGYATCGFDAVTTSNVLKGSGISSSAAFEDMVGTVFSHFSNEGKIGYLKIAQISQYAENAFFGKPCGLMDQVACAAGGIVSIDFADVENPAVEEVSFDFTAAGYRLCLVNTGGNHADLTPDYAAVPAEMKAVAAHFGKEVLREVDENEFYGDIAALRAETGDRAILRAIHFFEENKRVDFQKSTLREGNLEDYFAAVKASGKSSFCYLQNVYTSSNVAEQGVSLALCITEKFLSSCPRPSAYRVHGGGFAGTIQAYVPEENVPEYRDEIEKVFGKGSCHVLSIRQTGACRIF